MRYSLKNKKVLVTYGPTWVAIDDMRVLSNRSSGEMGKFIIADLLKAGATVTALEGPVQNPSALKTVRIKKFTFFDEFAKLFKSELKGKYDIVIHAAAVSDFKPKKTFRIKINSNQSITLKLLPTEKLIHYVKHNSPKTLLVGFKLESSASLRVLKKAAMTSMIKNHCDLVVANTLKNGYNGFIFNHNAQMIAEAKTRKNLSKQLVQCLCRQGAGALS